MRRWTGAVVQAADAVFTHGKEKGGRIVAVLGGRDDVEVHARCHPDGLVSLSAVAISDFRIVRVPWVWDSPGAKPIEPWFGDTSADDDDGGPETTH